MIRLTLFGISIIFSLQGCNSNSEPGCPKADCANYKTQQQAQTAFDADPKCKSELDSDKDGIACEHLPSSGGGLGCPTTGNCGCSNKTQNQCASACCKWVVGTGCRCI
jgi:Excalibur calcium-binding domain